MMGRKNEARQDSYEERRHDKASREYATRRYCADEIAFAWSLERGADLLRDHWVRRWTEVSSACHPGSYCIQRGTSRANAAECGHGTLESRAATGRDVAGQLVGSLPRTGIEYAGRSTEHQQRKYQSIFRRLYGSARDRPGSPCAILPHRFNGTVI